MIKHLQILFFVLVVTAGIVLVSGQTTDKAVQTKPTAASAKGIQGNWEGVLVHPAAKFKTYIKGLSRI
jgi:hypothetical protein